MELVELIRQERWGDALALCRKRPVAAARVLEVALDVRDQGRALIKERLEEVGRREAAEMERYIPVLGTIASIAPLLGLLGTVGGMILTFQVIEATGTRDMASLAGGISQALITTQLGLSVAIPLLLVHSFTQGRANALVAELDETAAGLFAESQGVPDETMGAGGEPARAT